MLTEEHRVAGFAEVARLGRANHRLWVETVFAAELRRLRGRPRENVLTALLVATDVHVWKVPRRDLGLDRPAGEPAMVRLVEGALWTANGRRSE
jgi:hypothetical protein